ncbi:MAG: hypothetical protein ACLQKA_02555 [Bryobacteraceae bacterium]
MKIDLQLADAASVDDRSKLYALGLGWTITNSPTPPIAILISIELDPEEVPSDLQLELELIDDHGQVARFPPLQAEEKGRPVVAGGQIQAPPLPENFPGDPLRIPLVVNIAPGIKLEPGQRYRFHATVTREGESIEDFQGFRVSLPDELGPVGVPVETRLESNTERSEIGIAATKLGFQISRNISTLTDTYERPDRRIRVRYDRSGKVLEVRIGDQQSAHPSTLEAALAALQRESRQQ